MKRQWPSVLLFLLAFGGMLAGLGWLVKTRFETGDAYPRGSSFRADPQGSKVLYESLRQLPELEVGRNFEPFEQLGRIPPSSTLLLLNLQGRALHELALTSAVEQFVSGGGRLVVAMNPDHVAEDEDLEPIADDDKDGEPSDEEESTDKDLPAEGRVFKRKAQAAEARFWAGLSLTYGKHEGGEAQRVDALSEVEVLPAMIPWREGGVLVDMEEVWQPVYQIGDEVVVAERPFGRGTIVVMTDDYLFMNEAMLKHRSGGFLAWCVGDRHQVLFDETHLGVASRTGIATLIRRYRLSGFFTVLVLLMGLLVWRGASPLVPPYSGRTRGNLVLADQSTEAGLADLLRRSLPRADLPGEAFRRWQASCLRSEGDRRYYARELEEAEAVLAEYAATPDRKRKPLATHLRIKSIIQRKKRKRL
ncbi:DUF4350 domain-containing protein [Coraliomargarita parva]|uniref:DUF4350 domain-containing protein n=1 Tax=Coraliomargarita parva TaxID=3014050 RepID=UPI0022B5A0D8|nr:DUF4350 domain-containing protein [Coraliomargarita parva]